MPESKSFLSRLVSELKRRKVPRVAAAYLAVAAAAIGAVTAAVATLNLPDRVAALFVLGAILGFPVAIVVSWVFDFTPEGVRRTEEEAEERLVPSRFARLALLGATLIATTVVGVVFWNVQVKGNAVATGAPAAAPLDPNHVAVLDLKDISPNDTLGWLADGLTETLRDRLGAVEALTVIPANGVRPFRDVSLSFDSIGRLLHAGSVIDGSVQGSGNRVRVNIQLVDASTGRQVTSRTFEGSQGDPFALQDSVSQNVARFLRKQLGEVIQLGRAKESAHDPHAWEQYERAVRRREDARSLDLDRDTAAAMRYYGQADSLFDLAHREDPGWIQPVIESGWTHLAMARARSSLVTEVDTVWLREGLRDANRVLDERPRYPAALGLRGVLEWFLGQRTDLGSARTAEVLAAAERDLRDATTDDPTLARAWGVLAFLRMDKGEFDEARIAARRMRQADPYLTNDPDYLTNMGNLYLDLHQVERADSLFRWGEQHYPRKVAYPYERLLIVASVPLQPGAVDSARALLRRTEALEGIKPAPRFYYAAVLARARLADSARSVARRALALDPDDPWNWHDDAYVELRLGARDSAIALLGRFLKQQPERRAGVAADWWWSELRDDPRFQALTDTSRASLR